MLRTLDPKFRAELIKKLDTSAPLIARLAERFTFIYDDIARIDDHGLQLLLRTVPEKDWLMAWKLTSPALQVRLSANMSDARRKDFAEQVAGLPKLPKIKVLRMQMQIAKVAHDLVTTGKVRLRAK